MQSYNIRSSFKHSQSCLSPTAISQMVILRPPASKSPETLEGHILAHLSLTSDLLNYNLSR